MKTEYNVIKKLLRSEKGLDLSEKVNQYLFDVSTKANKIEIKDAVEKIYKVKVQKVNTITMPRKPKVLRRDPGFTSIRKKAVVTLKKGEKIDLTT